ncbi:MAG: glycoside hydrolase family 3 N-terminal domain-containing protein, partial [Rhizobacter sp.]
MRRRDLLLAVPALACAAVVAAPAEGAEPVDTLLARMTVEEKVGQLSLFAPVAAGTIANPATRQQSAEEQLADLRAGRITGFFNGQGLAGKRDAQRIAVRETRLGIPLLFAADVIHGFRTVFP